MANNSSGSQDSGGSISRMAPVSWSVSEQIYEQIDSDIKINRLLATYHPDDGIIAYERILKAFGTSSETVTTDTWQELIQTLPLPNAASEDDVKEVICKVTGLSRDSLIFCNGTELPCEEMMNKKSTNCNLKNSNYQNSLRHENIGLRNSNMKLMQPEDNKLKRGSSISEEFLGFPPQEISVTTNRLHGGQSLREMLNCSSPWLQSQKETSNSSSKYKWIHSSRVVDKSNPYPVASKYRQTVLNTLQQNKYIQLPMTKLSNCNRSSSHGRSKMQNQVSSSETVGHSEARKTNFSEWDFKWDYCTSNFLQRDKQSCTATVDKFEEETKLRQQADIRKMDFVRYQEDCSTWSGDVRNESCESSLEENLAVSDRLKTCIQNFLSRAKQDIVVEEQSAAAIKSSNSETSCTESSSGSCSNYTRSATTKQVTIDNNPEFVAAVEIPKKHRPISISDGTKELIRKKLAASNDPSDPQNNTLPLQNLSYRTKRTEQNRIVLQQPTPATEFATFKKQYCDSLFNIQKAKVVTANAMSSVESAASSEACYSSCSYQQQLLRQEEQLMTSSQFTVPQSGLLNIHRVPCTWLRCTNWKHPIMGELKFQQQVARSEHHKVDAKPRKNKYSQSHSEGQQTTKTSKAMRAEEEARGNRWDVEGRRERHCEELKKEEALVAFGN